MVAPKNPDTRPETSAYTKIQQAEKLVESVRREIALMFSSGEPDGILELRDSLRNLRTTLAIDVKIDGKIVKRSIMGTFDFFVEMAQSETFGPDLVGVQTVAYPRKPRSKKAAADSATAEADTSEEDSDEEDSDEEDSDENNE